jgi:Aminotransferase class I and II
MNFDQLFEPRLELIRTENRYRVFADLERRAGHFPQAFDHRLQDRVTVWCSNDYLGMGQHPAVLAAMHDAIDRVGAGAGGTRNISGTSHYHVLLENELADLHGKEKALLFTSGYVANEAAISTLAGQISDGIVFSDAANHASMIQGIRHSGADYQIFRHNDPSRPREPPGGRRSVAAEARLLRVSLFHGWRYHAGCRDLRCRRAVRRDDLSRRGPCCWHVRPERLWDRGTRRRDASADRDPRDAWQGHWRYGRLYRRVGNADRLPPVLRARPISDDLLLRFGIYVQPINYPTVPRGTERLRLTPTPLHSDEHIDRLVAALTEIWSSNTTQGCLMELARLHRIEHNLR